MGHLEVVESEAEARAALGRTVAGLAVAAGAVSLVVLAGALWLGARFTGPLDRLTRAAAALGEGKAHPHVEVSGNDEVALLARAFSRMADAVARSQDEVAASDRRYRALYDSAPSGHLSAAPDGRITRCNPAMVALLGARSAEDLIGRPLMDLWAETPAGRARAAPLARRLYAGEDLPPQEIEMRRADGSTVWVTASVNAMRDPAGAIVLVHLSVVDITERRQAEVALRQSQQRLRSLIDGLGPDTFVGLMTPDGTVLEANRPALAAAGLTPEDVLGRRVEETYWWAYSGEVQQQLREAVARAARGEASRYEVPVRVAEGQFVVLDFSLQPVRDEAGNVVFLVPSANVVTERKRAEEAREGLARAAAALADSLDEAEVARRIVDAVIPLLGVRRATLRSVSDDGSLPVAAWAPREARPGPMASPIPPGAGLSARVLREGRAVWSADVLAEPDLHGPEKLQRRIAEDRAAAAIAAPLRAGGRIVAVLSAGDTTGRQFTPAEVSLLQVLADQAAVALERARLFEEEATRRREAEVLAQVVSVISASLDLDTVFQRVITGARELCGSDMARIVLTVPGSEAMLTAASVGARLRQWDRTPVGPGRGLIGRVLLTRRPVRTDDYLREPEIVAEYAALAREEGIVTGMFVPIEVAGRLEGVISVCNRVRRPFTDRDEAILLKLGDHAALAIANARLYREVQSGGLRLQALSRQLMDAQETERRQLARELHDEMGQALTAVKLNLQALGRLGDAGGPGSPLDETMGLVDRALQQVRDLSLDLRPSLLDDLGLAPALRWYADRLGRRAGLEITVTAALGEARPAPEVETACFRVAQEAMTNVARHAGARRASVEIGLEDGGLVLAVRDDGKGFDVAGARARAARGGSLGLIGMEERVLLLGGRLEIDSAPGRGTEMRARIPLASLTGGVLDARREATT